MSKSMSGGMGCAVQAKRKPSALVATGRAEVMVDAEMKLWDAAALQPIIEEAGGTFTDWQGQPTMHSGEAVACNGLVLGEVLAVTRRFPKPR